MLFVHGQAVPAPAVVLNFVLINVLIYCSDFQPVCHGP